MFFYKKVDFVIGKVWEYENGKEQEYINKIQLQFLPEYDEEIAVLANVLEGITSRKNCSYLIEQMAGEPKYIPIVKALIFSEKLNHQDIKRIYFYYEDSEEVCEAITFLEFESIPKNILDEILERFPEFANNN